MVRRSFGGLVSGVILLSAFMGSSAKSGTVDPTSRDYDLCARTVYGEMRGAKRAAQVAAVHIIYNRWKSRQWGLTIEDVVLARRQFSVWNVDDPNFQVVTDLRLEAGKRHRHFTKAVLHCSIQIALREEGYPDPTGGCLFYWTGEKVPYWARGRTPLEIGELKCIKSANKKKKRVGNKEHGKGQGGNLGSKAVSS